MIPGYQNSVVYGLFVWLFFYNMISETEQDGAAYGSHGEPNAD